jgi:ADP-ribose pyrophosphatase
LRSIYKGRVVDLNIEQVSLPNGKTIELEMVRHSGASAIVPLRDDGKVVIIHQYRYAAGGMIYEIPAGRLEADENPVDCAKRELVEEVGLQALQWQSLGTIFTTPGFTDEKIHLFLARGLKPAVQALEHDEVIEVVEKPLVDLISMIRRGKIIDSKTICGLMLAYFYMKELNNNE